MERSLAKAAIESNDVPRIAKYGESAAATAADDFQLLDRLAYAFLILGGRRRNAAKAYKYARAFEDLVDKMPVATGRDAAHQQDEQERAIGHALMYQARARTIQNDTPGRPAAGGPCIFGLSRRGNRPRMGGGSDSRGPAGGCDRAPGRGFRHSRSLRYR